MLPATLSQNVRRQIRHYLEATFNFRRKDEEAAFGAFVDDPANGLFKGPWVQLRHPFRPADEETYDPATLFDIRPPFHPFRHQVQAWRRLSAKERRPESTLVTTGTGSGKTECFMYPVLDHALRGVVAGERGVKSIILYPMNALAADQAGRFAELIFTLPELHSGRGADRQARVRVGLFTGRDDEEADAHPGEAAVSRFQHGAVAQMAVTVTGGREEYWHITDRRAMQENPPDILLTNYKMLDYLLMKPQHRNLWRFNEPGRLTYLVLDELHTYEGAQGADVGCLIRRLKERLDIPRGQLCCVGTSATIAAARTEEEMDPMLRLADFAGTLFEEEFTPAMVVDEAGNRFTAEELVLPPGDRSAPEHLPDAALFAPEDGETATAFARRIAPLFGAPPFPVSPTASVRSQPVAKPDEDKYWGLALGDWLRRQDWFAALLELTQAPVLAWDALVQGMATRFFSLRAAGGAAERETILAAFFALVAQALELRSGRALPLVPTQVQIWVRELRRLGRVVAPEPAFGWIDERQPSKPILPVAHCTECGEAAWVALRDADSSAGIGVHGVQGFRVIADPAKIYQGWNGGGDPVAEIVTFSPWHEGDDDADEAAAPVLPTAQWHFAPETMLARYGAGNCPLTGAPTFRVKLRAEQRTRSTGKVVGVKRCPHCDARDSLMFIGTRSATISSVAIDEIFGSVLNNDPKLLAFTDSVQDASHRAGFFSARTYQFTFRTALQRVIDAADNRGLKLTEAGETLLEYWSQPVTGRPGSAVEAMGTLLPPDLGEFGPYVDYREARTGGPPSEALRAEVESRLTWEATSEFGLMLTHGRTLETNASACLGWDADIIGATLEAVQARLPRIDPALERIGPDALRIWLYGLLQRQREQGGLGHRFITAYVRSGLWGKMSHGRVVRGRETFPLHGRYVPRLFATQREGRHTNLRAVRQTGAVTPWTVEWARRALGGITRLGGVGEVAIADLHDALLEEGIAAGLFEQLDRKDGKRPLYAIAAAAARLYGDGYALVCDQSGHPVFRPAGEAMAWEGAPSLVASTPRGRYVLQRTPSDRQKYYRARYRKGALRRVFAREHTGLLTTEEREELERRFNGPTQVGNPNVLTATSTLEMGIDIGDLSTTMLCSVPPTTASYVQRIGRAGRTTGTALVVSVVNQKPHDLFFFARPEEMLAGTIQPPGCWLDASAMLARQYLAYCIDTAVRLGVIDRLPTSGRRLAEEMDVSAGTIPDLLTWIGSREPVLQDAFLARFGMEVRDDTRDRLRSETATDRVAAQIREAAAEFGVQVQTIEAARRRLNDERRALADTPDSAAAMADIDRELRILRARMATLNRTAALEVLTEHGLLPNYAFPERGVRLAGTVYKEDETAPDAPDTALTIDVTRAATVALRELAPGNTFYTHSHQFQIQQLAVGSQSQPLVHEWAVCGKCGHMRDVAALQQPEAKPACPQCGYDRESRSQMDRAQWKPFLHFAQSAAISYMEYYASLSGDRAEEREQRFYKLVHSFDQTVGGKPGAVATEGEPFGIEYRSALVLRQVNAGGWDAPATFDFGPDQKVPEHGFLVCQDCGVAGDAEAGAEAIDHRRSCAGARRSERAKREGRTIAAFKWHHLYLYRELKSEAIRILLPPELDAADISTLKACLFLGMRLHFHGSPGHLLIEAQILPDLGTDLRRTYLVLMDAVPGGTGFLKSLFLPSQPGERAGEGIMSVLRRALNALESCDCRLLGAARGQEDTDGCYRCIRAYHLQYKAEEISRERGIVLLRTMIAAGEKRVEISALEHAVATSLYGSVLEKKFVDALQAQVVTGGGTWAKALVRGTSGFRFRPGAQGPVWDLQMQPRLGPAQGVAIACQPDFLLSCDDAAVKPIAVFTDGFAFHAVPDKAVSRLPDDAAKRRAILASDRYWVWAVAWDDLQEPGAPGWELVQTAVIEALKRRLSTLKEGGAICPPVADVLGHGFRQLLCFLQRPDAEAWALAAGQLALVPLSFVAARQPVGASASEMQDLHDAWRAGRTIAPGTKPGGTGPWCHATVLTPEGDSLLMGRQEDIASGAFQRLMVRLRLGDSADERAQAAYSARWRRWLGLSNVLQFCQEFEAFCVSEAVAGEAPDFAPPPVSPAPADWSNVMDALLPSLRALAQRMAATGIAEPECEYYLEGARDDCFAEMAWVERRICVLVGDQIAFREDWEREGWTVSTPEEIQRNGFRLA